MVVVKSKRECGLELGCKARQMEKVIAKFVCFIYGLRRPYPMGLLIGFRSFSRGKDISLAIFLSFPPRNRARRRKRPWLKTLEVFLCVAMPGSVMGTLQQDYLRATWRKSPSNGNQYISPTRLDKRRTK